MVSKKRAAIGALLLSGIGILSSHVVQEKLIENDCNSRIVKSQNDIREDLDYVLQSVSREITGSRSDVMFLVGDFRTEGGNARCGGIAKLVGQRGAERGFSCDIKLERHGITFHYYAVLSRDGRSFKINGGDDCLTAEEIKP